MKNIINKNTKKKILEKNKIHKKLIYSDNKKNNYK
jgi:hypothetical protein